MSAATTSMEVGGATQREAQRENKEIHIKRRSERIEEGLSYSWSPKEEESEMLEGSLLNVFETDEWPQA